MGMEIVAGLALAHSIYQGEQAKKASEDAADEAEKERRRQEAEAKARGAGAVVKTDTTGGTVGNTGNDSRGYTAAMQNGEEYDPYLGF